MKKNRSVTATSIGSAVSISILGTIKGVMSAGIAITVNMLNMFDPSTFPMAISGFPFFAAVTVTISSGSDVPRAIAVIAMSSVPMFMIWERVIIAWMVSCALMHMNSALMTKYAYSFCVSFWFFIIPLSSFFISVSLCSFCVDSV